jgi:hypothetical protein
LSNKQRAERKPSPEVIIVINALSGASLGRIGNLSDGGAMIITNQPIPEGSVIQIQFLLRDSARCPRRIEAGIQCLWSAQAQSDRGYWNGCQFVAMGEVEEQLISNWLVALP